jgi:hypothetical protein
MTTVQFPALGLIAADGEIRPFTSMRSSVYDKRVASSDEPIGPVAGARAEVVQGPGTHRVGTGIALGITVLPVVGLAAALTKKSRATAFIVTANGTVHEQPLQGSKDIARAQAEAVRFNVLAGQHRTAAP